MPGGVGLTSAASPDIGIGSRAAAEPVVVGRHRVVADVRFAREPASRLRREARIDILRTVPDRDDRLQLATVARVTPSVVRPPAIAV